MKHSPLSRLIFIFTILICGIQMNARAYTCPDAVNYFCANDDVIILQNLGDLPLGTFTRTDGARPVVVTQIDPSQFPEGAEIPIHFANSSLTFQFTCNFTIVIRALPDVSCPKLLAWCWFFNTVDLSEHPDFQPTGGVFSGDHVTGAGIFDLGSAGPGNHSIMYTVTSRNGCSNSCNTTISIVNGPVENCPANGIHVCYDEAIDLATLANILPAGGVYSGDYVTNNILEAPSPGTYEITYIYNPIQGCQSVCKFTVTLYPLPEFKCPEDMLICGLNGGSVTLPYPQQYSWNYEGDGVSISPTSGIPTFDPQKAGDGKHKITLTIYNDYKCETVCVFYITVSSISVDCPKLLEVCSNSNTDLTQLWNFNPKGVFSGELVSEDGVFSSPIVYEPEYSVVGYTLVDEYGCEASCEFRVNIIPYPRIECPDTIEACINDTTLVLIPNIQGGHFYLKDTEILNVAELIKLGPGTYEITYIYEYSIDPYCEYTCEFVLIIHPAPVLECPKDMTICLSDDCTGLPVPDFPNWTYSGRGINIIDGYPYFCAGMLPAGTYPVTLTVTDKNGCTASCSFKITVIEFSIECPKELWVCADQKADLKTQWNFNPKGIFSGDYVSTDGIFDAPMVYDNKCFEITYSLTNDAGCKDSCVFNVCVYPAPYIDCPDTVYLCINNGIYLPKIDYRYQFYWNNKEIPNGFNPATAGVGTHHVKVVYTANNELKCTYTCEFVIVVVPLPELECPDDMTLCSADQVITLPILPFPKYHYTGTGVFTQGGSYYFSAPKPGKYVVGAWVTDKYGCSDSCSFNIMVGEFNLECPKELRVCPDVKTDLATLWNFDSRGEFFGDWVTTDGIFYAPYIPGKNNCYIIKYRLIIDENCKDSCRFVVCVDYVPEVKCPDTLEVCIDDRPFNPAAGSNATVYFNGVPIPNGFDPAKAGPGTHIVTLEFTNTNSRCKSYCEMVIIVHPLPKIDCHDIYLCNPETAIKLPTYDYPYVEYKGNGIYFEKRIAHFKAPNGRPGTYTIWLYVKDEFGCTNSCSFNIIVGDVDVSCPEYLTVCPNTATDLTTLWNFNPYGIFTGPYVDANGNFNAPEVTGEKECFPIMFTLKTEDGCVDSCVFKVCVVPLPKIQCPDTIHVCINDNPFNPMPEAPGTIYFNDKPIPNGFNPAEAGVGTHYLYYTYMFSREPLCNYECKFIIVVHPLPEIECPNNILICNNKEKIELPKQPYPEYVYQGDGVSYESGHYYFNSDSAGTGSHVIMLVVYDEYGCKNICRFIIYVGDTKIDCPDTLWICEGTKGDLNKLWNFPYNGIFTGTGVTSDGIYYADEIMEKQCVDIYYHYYKYKCEDSCLFTLCVEPQPNIECPDTIHTCINGNPFIPIDSVSGTFYYKGEPLPNGYFNPMAYSEGTYTITYVETYGHNQECRFTCEIVVVIHSRIKLECPQDILICNTETDKIELPDLSYPYYVYNGDHVAGDPLGQVFLVAEAGTGIHYISLTVKDEWGCTASCRFRIIVGGNKIDCPDTLYLCPGDKYPLSRLFPAGGYFISNLVSNNWFTAPASDIDKCYDIKYVLKDTLGCIDSCAFVICVQGIIPINCPDTIKVCEDGKAFIPEIKPTGGRFKTADGAELPGGWFNPAIYGPGIYTIYYEYTTAAPYFCPLRCTFTIQVLPKPRIECPTGQIWFCPGNPPMPLNGMVLPLGGTYTMNGNVVTVFKPEKPGGYDFVYQYTDPVTGCMASCEFTLYVMPHQNVHCPKDTAVCANKGGVYELSGGEPEWRLPIEEEYHENGQMITHIHTDNPGEHTIWYVVTEGAAGCRDSCSFKVFVLAKPQVNCPDKITVCSENKLHLLEYVTKPTSEMYEYWFTGPGLSGDHGEIFEPYSLQQGEYLITYTVSVGNCVDSCSFWIVVIRPPMEINCPDDMTLCASSNAVNITALLSPTGAAPVGLVVTGSYLIYSATNGFIYFDPGKVDPKDYNKPIEISATSCTYYNDRKDSCCSTCTFYITVTDHANVECNGNIFACEGTVSIDLTNYVAPDGGEFYYQGSLTGKILYLANLPSLQDIRITYYFPKRGVDCADSCTLTLKILPAPAVSLRDTICSDNAPFVITNNQVEYATLYNWFSNGDGTFVDSKVLHPTYNPGIGDFNRGKVMLILNATNESCESKGSMIVSLGQQLQFPAGWGGVSLYRDPVDDNLENIVEPIKNDLNLIYNLNGEEYAPPKSILTTWDKQTGYIANSTNGSLLLVAGSYNNGQPLYVTDGWNLIPVLSKCPANVEILTFNANLNMVKEVAGLNVYWPDANVFDLTQLEPGKSYMADFIGSETIIFPSCDPIVLAANKSVITDPFIPGAWGELHKTPTSFVVALPVDQFAGQNVVDGDVIGAFTPEGILGGICEIGLNNSLVLFGNDPLTNIKDGFNDCDSITLKLYKHTTGAYYSIDPIVMIEGSLDCFTVNGNAKIGQIGLTDVLAVQRPKFLVYPNPANHSLNVVSPSENVSCTIFNVTGQVLIHQQLEQGMNKLSVQLLRSGIYIIQFKDENYTTSKRFVKQ